MKVLDSLRSQLRRPARTPSDLDQETPADPRLTYPLAQIAAHRFGPAQRALEALVRVEHHATAAEYLEDLRALRYCLRRVEKRPLDAGLRLELGMHYFALEMGEEAQHEWERALDLDPSLVQAHSFLAVEHLFRGNVAEARRAYSRACALDPTLPGFAELLHPFEDSQSGVA